jgi:hypothetical protein
MNYWVIGFVVYSDNGQPFSAKLVVNGSLNIVTEVNRRQLTPRNGFVDSNRWVINLNRNLIVNKPHLRAEYQEITPTFAVL